MNGNDAFDFGMRVKEERTKLGMTQKELGKAIDVGEDSIACYETLQLFDLFSSCQPSFRPALCHINYINRAKIGRKN